MKEPRTEEGMKLVGQYHRAMHGEDCELEDDGFIRDRVLLIEQQALDAYPLPPEDHHGKPHEFRCACRICGQPGLVQLSISGPDEVVRVVAKDG